ncbi:MAG: polyphosphate kinase [Sphingomicrobium sp.]
MTELRSDPTRTPGEAQSKLCAELARAQLAQIAHGRRVIVLVEGPDGAGKKAALKALAATFDPCHFAVHCIHRERRSSADGHWLARFWRHLPAAGETTMFLRSWYRRVIDERLAGEVEGKMLARAFDEINEFEAQQRDYGTLLVKLFFTVDPEVQARRLAERAADPWLADASLELDASHPGYGQAIEDLRDNSDTRWSPWTFIDGNDSAHAADSALTAVLDAYRLAMPLEPPHMLATGERAA